MSLTDTDTGMKTYIDTDSMQYHLILIVCNII